MQKHRHSSQNREMDLPVNFSKAWDVSFQHLCKNLRIKVLLNTLLRAKILQDSSDVWEKNFIQCAVLNGKDGVVIFSMLFLLSFFCLDVKKGKGSCLPEICIRNVSLNKFVKCTVDDFVEVHRVLLLCSRGHLKDKKVNRCRTLQWAHLHAHWKRSLSVHCFIG